VDAKVREAIDAALVRLADGDRSAFDPAFNGLWPVVLALSTRLLGSKDEAEDAAQEAMYKVFARIDELDVDRSGVSWALGIAAWECRARRTSRLRRREDHADGGRELASEALSPEEDFMARELVVLAEKVLGALSTADQEALRATFEERPVAKGATFRKRRERALFRLRNAWRKLYEAF